LCGILILSATNELPFHFLLQFYFGWPCDDDLELLPAELQYDKVWKDIEAVLQPFLMSHPSLGHLEDPSDYT
jgi:hypothetical protein